MHNCTHTAYIYIYDFKFSMKVLVQSPSSGSWSRGKALGHGLRQGTKLHVNNTGSWITDHWVVV